MPGGSPSIVAWLPVTSMVIRPSPIGQLVMWTRPQDSGSTGSIHMPFMETWGSYRSSVRSRCTGVVAAQAWGEQAVG